MDQLHEASAVELAAAIRSGQVSSREVLDHLLDRIARLDGPVNSVVLVDAERARAEAAEADAAVARGDALGPLHGVPMTIKDSFSTAGMTTTSGAPELADHVPIEDAAPVARLREAGAVVFGKTNLPIYAGDAQTYNDVYGTTSNPHDLTRTPGGSSGGSAAALAARFTPLELGSDIGGSIRLPAHMAGVVGHKPSYGIVPAHGQIPGPPGTLTQADLAVAGPMARTVEDCELGLELMAGPDRWHRKAWRLELPDARHRSIGEYRIAAWLDDPAFPVDSGVRGPIEAAAQVLADAGAVVDDQARPDIELDKSFDTFLRLLNAALAGGYPRQTIERFAGADGPSLADRIRRYTAARHREWLSANERRLQMRRRWEEFFGDVDVVLAPVAAVPAFVHDHSAPAADRVVTEGGTERAYMDLLGWMSLAGPTYLPSTVVPVGLTGTGLPVGIQVIGAYLEDRTTLAVARALQERIGPCPLPTGF